MIHVDIFYDYTANQMKATVDTNYGIPKLVPLPPGYAFDIRSNYFVLSGKAYSLQYAWNPGGTFTPPEGAAVWIECLSIPLGLENYDGPGNKNENPPRPYTPIFGTGGSPSKWKWYGRMAHNAYAIYNPRTNLLTAEYRVYFGDAETGARDAYANYTDTTVKLTWTVDPPASLSVAAMACHGSTFTVSFDGEPGKAFYLERVPFIGAAPQWETVAGPLAGAHSRQSLTDTSAPGGQSFYRLRAAKP
jgi:hypothetical protein